MSEEEVKPRTFTNIVPPDNDQVEKLKEQNKSIREEIKIKQESVDEATANAQVTYFDGLSKKLTEMQLQNMQKLAPLDEFIIGEKTWKRNKIKPRMLRELKKEERKYNEDIKNITDPDEKQERDWKLLAYKAKLYFGMSEQEFEDTDIEYLQTVIQATELRTQGFRQY